MAFAIKEIEALGLVIGGGVARGAVIGRGQAVLDGAGQGILRRSDDDAAGFQAGDSLLGEGRRQCARSCRDEGDEAGQNLVHESSFSGASGGRIPASRQFSITCKP